MLHLEAITYDSPCLPQVMALYQRAFPENERRPLKPLLDDVTHCSDFVAFFDGELFVGFACLLTWQDITHLIYFAIDDALRGRGYGSEALRVMLQLHPGHRYIADLESPDSACENNDQRIHRRQFYLRAGYAPTEVRYRWRGDDYEILALGGTVTRQEFWDFWKYYEVNREELSDF